MAAPNKGLKAYQAFLKNAVHKRGMTKKQAISAWKKHKKSAPKAAKKPAKRGHKKSAKKHAHRPLSGKQFNKVLAHLKKDFFAIARHKGATTAEAHRFVRMAFAHVSDLVKQIETYLAARQGAKAAKAHEQARVKAAKLAEKKLAGLSPADREIARMYAK